MSNESKFLWWFRLCTAFYLIVCVAGIPKQQVVVEIESELDQLDELNNFNGNVEKNNHRNLGFLHGNGKDDNNSPPPILHEGILIYEYPAPEGQSVESLIKCMIQQKKPDPRVDSTQYHGHYPPEDIAEYFLHVQLLKSFRKTDDPSKASIFFVNTAPVISANVNKCNGMTHYERQQMWTQIIKNSPYFQERPLDHAFVCQSWRCFGYVQHMIKPVVSKMRYLIHERNERWIGVQGYDMNNTVVIPYVAHDRIKPFNQLPPTDPYRKYRVTFYGSLTRRTRLRSIIEKGLKGVHVNGVSPTDVHQDEIHNVPLDPKEYDEYGQVMRDSTFCLIPEGDTPSSRRLFDAMMSGCIPVFITWGYERPFENLIPYDDFSIRISPKRWLRGSHGNGGNAEAQLQIDELFAMPREKIQELRYEMAKYIKYINWREEAFVIEGIVDSMVQKRNKGLQVSNTF